MMQKMVDVSEIFETQEREALNGMLLVCTLCMYLNKGGNRFDLQNWKRMVVIPTLLQ